MDPQRTTLRAVRVDDRVLIECDTCGPVAVLTDPATEHLFVTAHMIAHRTGRPVVVKE